MTRNRLPDPLQDMIGKGACCQQIVSIMSRPFRRAGSLLCDECNVLAAFAASGA
jgi:hypothetical protein